MDKLYPVTIISTRYGGAYEGMPWAAFNCYPERIPSAATADDVTCSMWWGDFGPARWVGRGISPTTALLDLQERMKQAPPEHMMGRIGLTYGAAGRPTQP